MKKLWLLLFLVFLVGSGDSFARGGGGGGRSSSSGGRSFSSGSSSRSFSSGSSSKSGSSNSSRSYSSGSKSASPSKASSFDSKAASSARVQTSRTFWGSSQTTYTRPPVSPPAVQTVKRQTFYRSYYSNPTVVHYHYRDPYNDYFWYWMLSRSLDDRAMWAYNHRQDMDDARYREMISKDAQLEQRVRELEGKGVQKDPNYRPAGMDDDLIYKSDDEVKADAPEGTSWGQIRQWTARILGGLLLLGLGIWLVFFKRWDV